VISQLALRSGWRPDQVAALRAGQDLGQPGTDALLAVIREAAAGAGWVRDTTWDRAVAAGWTDGQLAEAFAYLALTLFTGYFLNYAGTDLDLPADPARAAASGGR